MYNQFPEEWNWKKSFLVPIKINIIDFYQCWIDRWPNQTLCPDRPRCDTWHLACLGTRFDLAVRQSYVGKSLYYLACGGEKCLLRVETRNMIEYSMTPVNIDSFRVSETSWSCDQTSRNGKMTKVRTWMYFSSTGADRNSGKSLLLWK